MTDLVVLEENCTLSDEKMDRRRWLQRQPWLGWAFTYVLVLVFCFIYRCTTLSALILTYGTEKENKFPAQLAVLCLGFLEDFVCATYLAAVLWLVDKLHERLTTKNQDADAETTKVDKLKKFAELAFIFTSSWILFVMIVGPFAADLLLVNLRGVRFTFQLLSSNKKDSAIDGMSGEEMNGVYVTTAITSLVAGIFAVVRTFATWSKLSAWNPTDPVVEIATSRLSQKGSRFRSLSTKSSNSDIPSDEIMLEVTESSRSSGMTTPNNLNFCDLGDDNSVTSQSLVCRRGIQASVLLLGIVFIPLLVVGVANLCPSLVANAALNATLNELFGHALGDTSPNLMIVDTNDNPEWVNPYIHSATENYTLLQDDSLYRRTTGFKGDLAFDVNISDENPPNVLLLVVESFRFHDSHYLVGEDDPSNLFKGTNLTITPNFDKWAQRGIGLTNFWSSWRTSRSVESLEYAQIPYDSVEDSGMTGGKTDIELAGLPQLFKLKGYESFFTTGCQTEYDDWNSFLPAHGFDTVWSRDEMMEIAERDLNISSDDWYGEQQRGLYWGLHDDLSFQILGDLLVNKTQEQNDRVTQGEDKKPLFLTHYTISSHMPFQERPKWYAEAEKPDFSALYEGEEYADLIRDYLEMRYFTDLEFGKFMDRMAEEGILNDTIVIISGDHGQAPEFGYDKPELRDLSATRVAGALVAEGRLGQFAGTKFEHAAEQYDILNTLADITGIPDEGFFQNGVGRSLKRKVPFGERVLFSNNPSHKMSVVRGNQRLQYDRHSNEVLLHDARTDHDMKNDLFPDLTTEEQEEWLAWRKNGRWINTYYTTRWDQNCLLIECDVAA